ncbi:MAG: ribosome biogenesis/translation initiation ATPase RLI [Thermoplasmata archaeon]|nr:MAG: ribosome biogenesis/translation initiation ATPase RLI [Thermoplasmata archaeon]
MRIAWIDRDRCQPKKCALECMKYCPMVRTGKETVKIEDGKPVIAEELCMGCGICAHKCPFEAIKIIRLSDELREELVHQYGPNSFRLFGLPVPVKGEVVGILGENGTGKTTAINILAGMLIPNLGFYDKKVDWDFVLEGMRSTEVRHYLRSVANKEIRASLKPQQIEYIIKNFGDSIVKDVIRHHDENDLADFVCSSMEISSFYSRKCSNLSGGEMQRLAIALTMLRDADIYFFDEPTSYLDIRQRMNMAKALSDFAKKRCVIVVEHDLAILDFLADTLHIVYGVRGAYGVFTKKKGTRRGINEYLDGYLVQENVRIREKAITFEKHPPRSGEELLPVLSFTKISKNYGDFVLEVNGGSIRRAEVVGVVGPNAIGKTTFVKILAGVEKADEGRVERKVRVSYKPQYIKADIECSVGELFQNVTDFISVEVIKPLSIDKLWNRSVASLSGGELQIVATALCLSKNADIYLIDEPSAYLDVNMRILLARVIRRFVEKSEKPALVVDHDIYFIDMIADSLMVFSGTPSVHGSAQGPMPMREGMNLFLSELEITFRRDEESGRPRVNKPGSRLDREQKDRGEYYYV